MRLVLLPLFLIGIVSTIALASRGEAREAALRPEIKLVEVGRFDEPVYVASPRDDARLFVVERKGRIRILVDGLRLDRPFLDLARRVSSRGLEEGLLSVAFAPDYPTSGRFYVDYTDLQHRTVIDEFRRSADPNVADRRTRRQVLVIPNPTNRHHGGHLLFGPDGYLYVSQGDGGIFHDLTFPAQRLDSLHGKILRIDPRPQGGRPYRTPPDNPFVRRPGRDEIWAYGLRNPWRLAFDPATGSLLIGDVGQVRSEEIDLAPRGGLNFGWPCFEGNDRFNPEAFSSPRLSCNRSVPPLLERLRSPAATVEPSGEGPTVTRGRPRARVHFTLGELGCSIVVGTFVEDLALPSLVGRHVYGDFCNPMLRSFRLAGARVVDDRPLGIDLVVLSSFGVDAAGHVYATSLAGSLYRLEAG